MCTICLALGHGGSSCVRNKSRRCRGTAAAFSRAPDFKAPDELSGIQRRRHCGEAAAGVGQLDVAADDHVDWNRVVAGYAGPERSPARDFNPIVGPRGSGCTTRVSKIAHNFHPDPAQACSPGRQQRWANAAQEDVIRCVQWLRARLPRWRSGYKNVEKKTARVWMRGRKSKGGPRIGEGRAKPYHRFRGCQELAKIGGGREKSDRMRTSGPSDVSRQFKDVTSRRQRRLCSPIRSSG